MQYADKEARGVGNRQCNAPPGDARLVHLIANEQPDDGHDRRDKEHRQPCPVVGILDTLRTCAVALRGGGREAGTEGCGVRGCVAHRR